MKNLREFVNFDYNRFLKEKSFVVKEVKDTIKYEDGKATDEVLGTTVVCIIMRDETLYKKDDEEVRGLNLFEEIRFKTPVKNLKIPQNTQVVPAEIVKASIYGDFQNQLSIECKNVRAVNS